MESVPLGSLPWVSPERDRPVGMEHQMGVGQLGWGLELCRPAQDGSEEGVVLQSAV